MTTTLKKEPQVGKFPHEEIDGANVEEGLNFNFSFDGYLTGKQIDSLLSRQLTQSKIDWLYYENGRWIFFSEKFKAQFQEFNNTDWLKSQTILIPELEYCKRKVFDENIETTKVRFYGDPRNYKKSS